MSAALLKKLLDAPDVSLLVEQVNVRLEEERKRRKFPPMSMHWSPNGKLEIKLLLRQFQTSQFR